jgi:hypothetical protein
VNLAQDTHLLLAGAVLALSAVPLLPACRSTHQRARASRWWTLVTLGLLAIPSTAEAQAQESTNAWEAAHASAAVTICLRSFGTGAAQLQEALHRIEAELSASGFLVDQAEPNDARSCMPNDPSIKLRQSASAIDIAASAGPGDDPVQQTVSTKDASTTAELIAIRAVEGLRAAMMQALRRSPAGADGAPETVRRFTHQEERAPPAATDEPPLAPAPTAPEKPDASGDGSSSNPHPSTTAPVLDLLMTVGGTLAWDGANPGMNGTLSVAWLLPPIALGIGIDAGIIPGTWNATAGSIELRPFGLTGTVALRMPCGPKWECHLGAAAGLRQFSMAATAAASGSVTAHENHSSAVVMLDGLVGYFPIPKLGMFVRAQGGLLLDAPALALGDEELDWGRASLGLGLGVAARF